MPQSQREERARQVIAILTGIVTDIKGDISSEESILKAIAQITELNYNSVVTVARSCSYFGPERMEKLRAKLAEHGSRRDITKLGEDPRCLGDGVNGDDVADDEAVADEGSESGGSPIREFAAVLAELGANDVLVITGGGSHQLFRQDESVVLVIRGKETPTVHSIPAGCKVGKAVVMQSPSGDGIVSVPFETVREPVQ